MGRRFCCYRKRHGGTEKLVHPVVARSGNVVRQLDVSVLHVLGKTHCLELMVVWHEVSAGPKVDSSRSREMIPLLWELSRHRFTEHLRVINVQIANHLANKTRPLLYRVSVGQRVYL